MSQLTSNQATELSRQFFCIGRAIASFREHHWNNIGREQHQQLSKMQWSIYNYADDLLALSAVISLNEVEESLNQIGHVTREVVDFIEQEQDVNKVINVAARVVVLGGAVISQSPLAVVSTLAELTTIL